MGQSFRIVANPHIMKMLVVLALAAAVCAEPEAEADPLTYLTNYPSVYSAPSVATPLLRAFGNPAVTYKTTAAPAVTYKAVATPAVTYNHASVATPAVTYNSPVVYSHPVSTHSLTSYKNPEHYTADSNGAVGPSYIAKNGPTVHVVKREAEADPALVYNNLPLPYNTLPATTYNTYNTLPVNTYNTLPVHTYNTVPITTTYNAVAGVPYNTHHAVAYTPAGVTHSS